MQGRKIFKIGIVAGEVSGDMLAAGLIRQLRQYPYTFEFTGITGPMMQQQSCKSLYTMDKLTLMGLDMTAAELGVRVKDSTLRLHPFKADFYDLYEMIPGFLAGVNGPHRGC